MKMRTGIDCKGRQWEEQKLTNHMKDITGMRFERLIPLFRVKNTYTKDKGAYWLCQCDCGNQVVSSSNGLNKGLIKSCGCFQKDSLSKRNRANLIGQRFNMLTVIECLGSYGINQNVHWKCRCDCGNLTIVTTAHLREGHTLSCGCLNNRPNRQSYGEQVIENILKEHNIPYLMDTAYFKDLRMANNGIGRYDFIILDENSLPIRLIEFDGIQHFQPSSHFPNATKLFEYTQINDKIKNEYALSHNLPLVRIPYTELCNLNLDILMNNKYLIGAE